MIVQAFLKWARQAGTGDRARAANALARAYLVSDMSLEDRHAAEAAMAFLLDDPSPKVRLALAKALASSSKAPRSVVLSLAQDQVEIATHVLTSSPVLGNSDLVDLVASRGSAVQRIVANRMKLPAAVCAALAEVGCAFAVADMLENPGAAIAGISVRRIAERHGDNATIRSLLLERDNLPCDVRHALILKIGDALAVGGFISRVMGADRLRRVTEEACENATLQLAGTVSADELPALVEHLRITGRMTPAFLIHALCTGNVDFFAAAIVSLSGQSAGRVRGMLVDGRKSAISALYRQAGIPAELCDIFVNATLIWREATRSDDISVDTGAVTERLVSEHAALARKVPAVGDLLALVERMNLAYRRETARAYALELQGAAA